MYTLSSDSYLQTPIDVGDSVNNASRMSMIVRERKSITVTVL